MPAGRSVGAGRVLQELHEVAVGIDDHDVILAGEGVLVRLQATVKAVEFLVSTVGVRVDPGGFTVTLTAGFLSFGLAISFFLMWKFPGSGQPSNMVRLMAFRDSLTLKRAIFTMAPTTQMKWTVQAGEIAGESGEWTRREAD